LSVLPRKIFFFLFVAVSALQVGCTRSQDLLKRDLDVTDAVLRENRHRFRGRELEELVWQLEAARAILSTSRAARKQGRLTVALELESRVRDYLTPALEMLVEQDVLGEIHAVKDSGYELEKLSGEKYPAAVAIVAYRKMVKGARDGDRKKNLAEGIRGINERSEALGMKAALPRPEIQAREVVIGSEASALKSLRDSYPDLIRHTLTLLSVAEAGSVKISQKDLESTVWRRLIAMAADASEIGKLNTAAYSHFVASMKQSPPFNGPIPEMQKQTQEFLRLAKEIQRRLAYYSELSLSEICDSNISTWEDGQATLENVTGLSRNDRSVASQTDECIGTVPIVPRKMATASSLKVGP
jgi:hypothetical protein